MTTQSKMIAMFVDRFLRDFRTPLLHEWNEQEKLRAFCGWIVAQKHGLEAIQDLKREQDQAISELLSEEEVSTPKNL